MNNIKITPALNIHPEYNEILYGIISWNNGNFVANRKKTKNKNDYIYSVKKQLMMLI